MQAIADLLEEQVKRREYHRKFNDDNARRMWGLEVMEPDPPKIHKHVHVHQKKDQQTQQEQTGQPIQQIQQIQPAAEETKGDESLLKKWGPAALVGATLGAAGMGIPWLLDSHGNDAQPVIENAADGDSRGEITIQQSKPGKKSIFTVIQDEMKHIEN